jgi:rRNA-processing protein FCF1
MRLKHPGGIDEAIKTVNEVQGRLMTTLAASGQARKSTFLSWCDDWATAQLGNNFHDSETIFGDISESYNRLALAPEMSESQLNGLLNREFGQWNERLASVLADLWKMREFLTRPGRLVVLDTSALMEGVFFTEFPWHELDPSLRADAVRLIVLSLVVEELDDLKRPHRHARQKARARQVLTALWDLHRNKPAEPAALPAATDVTIEVVPDSGRHQRMPNNDGEIIDQAVGLGELTGRPVILAAGDYTQLYRAASAGLTAVLMPLPATVPAA